MLDVCVSRFGSKGDMIVEFALQESEVEQFVGTHPNVICESCKLETFVSTSGPFEIFEISPCFIGAQHLLCGDHICNDI